MDLDPVLLARLQFAFTISFHIIFPSFTIGLAAYIATLLGDVAAHRAGPLSAAGAVLDQDLRGLVRHGRRLGHRAVVPVRHQLEPLLGRHRQRDRARDRLRGADRLLPRSDVPRRAAVRLESRAALALGARPPRSSRSAPRSRHSGFSPPTAGCRRPTGHEVRDGIAYPVDWFAIIFNPSFPYRLAHMLTAAYLTTALRRAGGRRALSRGRTPRGRRAHHGAHGDRHDRDPGAAAALHRRPARAQHAQAPADQDRRHGGALGRLEARRLPHLRLAGREERGEPLRDLDSARLLARSHA